MKLTISFEVETISSDFEHLEQFIQDIENAIKSNIYTKNSTHIDTIIHYHKVKQKKLTSESVLNHVSKSD